MESLTFSTTTYIFIAILIVIILIFSVKIVPQSEKWVVERIGKYNRTLEAGLQLIIPLFESIKFKVAVQVVA